MNMPALINDWHKQELQADYGLAGARLVMGCPLWGDAFVSDFLNYCLPSLAANRLKNCEIVLFVDGPTEQRLQAVPIPTPIRVRRLPEPIAKGIRKEGTWKYSLLAAAHNLLIHKAAEAGAGWHMLVADAIYSSAYFDNLKRLAEQHDAIVHTGFAIVGDTGKPMLDVLGKSLFGRGDELRISAKRLGEIGWEYLNPQWASWTMNGTPDDFSEMPNSHYIHWRGRDHVRIHCAHQSAAWISPERCRQATPGLGGTIDSELPRYMAGDFYAPTLADEMTYIVIAGATQPTPRIPFDAFKSEFWRFIGDNRAFMPYFMAPCVVPVPYDHTAPSDEELDARLASMMAKLEEGRAA